MVANISNPTFTGGVNVAIKVPLHQYDATVAFYRDTLNLPLVEEEAEGCIFQFGPVRLWVDKAPNLARSDVWLELETSDTMSAARYLKNHGVPRCDELESLPEDFDGFYVSDPAGVVHLVVGETDY
ncbi:MAG: VOC family protein [Chthoniobacteraceae bacterium]